MPFTGTFHQKIRVGRYATGLSCGLIYAALRCTTGRGRWLWHGRMARGKHTCIGGESGTGKSLRQEPGAGPPRSRQAGGYRPACQRRLKSIAWRGSTG